MRLRLAAPAKLNLFLRVLGRRADGYHEIESLLVPVSLADLVEVESTTSGRIELIDPPEGLNEHNELSCRAARALAGLRRERLGARIRLRKRIPSGAGLGGGSSDAAAVMLALNRLWDLRLPRPELMRIAVSLGADIPFFLGSGPALVRGIGEMIEPVSLPNAHWVIAYPGVAAPTAKVYASPLVRRDRAPLATRALPASLGGNDLQAAACSLVPEIEVLASALRTRGLEARMSGSGSALFARCASARESHVTAAGLRDAGWQAWAARSLARLPGAHFL
ncbi:MAG: 4-(cytidine 5'-diphospho)-2-C-methyl-D-erythritol kinase [Casimicrobiaceae bacterium]|nr:4-(cytidine 5'-diphospho)-2-C-methyl-D-erythritol kinase [Casimicrobiaceae bacterium]MCX8097418.1 4-(cytidine 5'-diphospho)-2-C-methyl-D-erythritol kinase [Casimicrobiaceae bacterium]MDW8312052.1 4-(cytidine 5'-diphospho)-2-C-methyl-D-erythritol kinase [Burkholderiales bacterium]